MQEACSELAVNVGAGSATGAEKEQSLSEKEQSDDPTSNQSRGWLNWLSRGMLGAGGTEDSSQFSGVVSDEIVKVFRTIIYQWSFNTLRDIIVTLHLLQDIHEATKFDPLSSSPRIISATGKICTCFVRLDVQKVSATLQHING